MADLRSPASCFCGNALLVAVENVMFTLNARSRIKSMPPCIDENANTPGAIQAVMLIIQHYFNVDSQPIGSTGVPHS